MNPAHSYVRTSCRQILLLLARRSENSHSLEGSRDAAALDPHYLVSRLRASWIQAARTESGFEGGVPPVLTPAEGLRGARRLRSCGDNSQTSAKWRRGRSEKRRRSWTSSIRSFCPSCCGRKTTSSVPTARRKVSLGGVGCGELCQTRERGKKKGCGNSAASGALKLATQCNVIHHLLSLTLTSRSTPKCVVSSD